uniref:Uncharacterized protein n=1 Tax=Sphaerodactylus townsendi TaxID=933632 RepID=A0ACB8G3J0_9SAUR
MCSLDWRATGGEVCPGCFLSFFLSRARRCFRKNPKAEPAKLRATKLGGEREGVGAAAVAAAVSKHAGGSSSGSGGGRQKAGSDSRESASELGPGELLSHSQGCWGAMPGGRRTRFAAESAAVLLARAPAIPGPVGERPDAWEFNYYLPGQRQTPTHSELRLLHHVPAEQVNTTKQEPSIDNGSETMRNKSGTGRIALYCL